MMDFLCTVVNNLELKGWTVWTCLNKVHLELLDKMIKEQIHMFQIWVQLKCKELTQNKILLFKEWTLNKVLWYKECINHKINPQLEGVRLNNKQLLKNKKKYHQNLVNLIIPNIMKMFQWVVIQLLDYHKWSLILTTTENH
jgi:hypothetical protein